MNIWDQDISYTSDIVADIVGKSTDLAVREVKFIGEGFDNSVFLINEKFIFRFVRREEGLAFLKSEMIALPLLSKKLPIKIPQISYKGTYLNKWLWVGYPYLKGEPFYKLDLPEDVRCESAVIIARFLKILHGLNIKPFENAGLPCDWLGHMDLAKRLPFSMDKLNLLVEAGVIQERHAYKELLERVSHLKKDNRQAIVHGDFKTTHILFDTRSPQAIIDWGDVHIGHPATDLSIAYTFFPPEGRRSFQNEYGETSNGDLWTLAQFRAFFHTLTIIEYSFKTKQELIFDEALKALQWTFEE